MRAWLAGTYALLLGACFADPQTVGTGADDGSSGSDTSGSGSTQDSTVSTSVGTTVGPGPTTADDMPPPGCQPADTTIFAAALPVDILLFPHEPYSGFDTEIETGILNAGLDDALAPDAKIILVANAAFCVPNCDLPAVEHVEVPEVSPFVAITAHETDWGPSLRLGSSKQLVVASLFSDSAQLPDVFISAVDESPLAFATISTATGSVPPCTAAQPNYDAIRDRTLGLASPLCASPQASEALTAMLIDLAEPRPACEFPIPPPDDGHIPYFVDAELLLDGSVLPLQPLGGPDECGASDAWFPSGPDADPRLTLCADTCRFASSFAASDVQLAVTHLCEE